MGAASSMGRSLSRRALVQAVHNRTVGAVAGTAVGATALALGGCAPGQIGTPAEAPAPKLRSGVTLLFTHFSTVAAPFNDRVTLFQKDTPGIQVNTVQLQGGDAYRDKLVAMFAGDQPPVLFVPFEQGTPTLTYSERKVEVRALAKCRPANTGPAAHRTQVGATRRTWSSRWRSLGELVQNVCQVG
jgi:hypothetical protein